jgi:hypothetical protein
LDANQVAEQQRLQELKRTDPGLAQAQIAQAAQKKTSLMPDQTRDALKKLSDAMRQAAGLQPTPTSATTPAGMPPAPKSPRPPDQKAKPAVAPERRADVPPAERQRP